jgi:hypothetical protein
MPGSAQFDAVNPDISLAAVHDRMVVFAQDEHEHLIHIDAARRGKACNCHCLACGEALIARHGDIKAHSFAHESGAECLYAIDAMLNRLAKELIAARGCFRTPRLTVTALRAGPISAIKREEIIASRNVPVESVGIESRVHRQRPSVVMQIKGRELLLEVTHAHHLDASKRAAIEKLGVPAVEMHLSEFKFENVEQFERMLVDDTRNKRWILNPKASEIQHKLDGVVEEQLAQQNAQYAERLELGRQQQAALAAAKLAREQEAAALLTERLRRQAQQDHGRRLEQARLDSLEAAAREKPPEARRQTLHYSLQDGGLTIRREPGGQVLIVADIGNEQVLGMLVKLGLMYDSERGGYPSTVADLADILPALQPHVKNVRSV